MQYKSILYGHIIMYFERIVNETYSTKMIIGSKSYSQTDSAENIIPLNNIFCPLLKVFITDCVNNFPGNLCLKPQLSYFLQILIHNSR